MRKIVRTWLRSWAPVDVLVLGGGLFAAKQYFSYWETHQTSPDAWFDIWPNMATEVIGAWLSVRVIDYLIRRREQKSQSRLRIIDILLYIRDLARGSRLGPDPSGLLRLGDELRYFEEAYNARERERNLSDDERLEVGKVRNLAADLLLEARKFQGCSNRSSDSLRKARSALDALPYDMAAEQRNEAKQIFEALERVFDLLREYGPFDHERVAGLPDPRAKAETNGSKPKDNKILEFDRCAEELRQAIESFYTCRKRVEEICHGLEIAVELARQNILMEETEDS